MMAKRSGLSRAARAVATVWVALLAVGGGAGCRELTCAGLCDEAYEICAGHSDVGASLDECRANYDACSKSCNGD